MKSDLRQCWRYLFVAACLSPLMPVEAASRLGRHRDGTLYVVNEIQFALKSDFAATLNPLVRPQRVDRERLRRLHPAIAEVQARHTAAERWIEGADLPARVRLRRDEVPKIARSLTAVLKEGADAVRVVAELRAQPEVDWASPVVACSPQHIPNDPGFGLQWGMNSILAPEAWDVEPATAGIDVAIVDTGVSLHHDELEAIISYQKGFGPNSNGGFPPLLVEDVDDSASHGTHVAGIVAAIRDNNIGIAGVARARIMAMGCAKWGAPFTNEYLIAHAEDAINDAIANGAEIINCSFSAPVWEGLMSPSMGSALDNARSHDVLVVCAAGNESKFLDAGADWDAHDHPFIISATDNNQNVVSFSNFGPGIDLAAPGEDILSTLLSSFGNKSGTSMAAPHVAGAAAVVMSMNPSRIGDNAGKHLLQRMAEDGGLPGKDGRFGWGRLKLRYHFIRTIRRADMFLGHPGADDVLHGSYDSPIATIPFALAVAPTGATLVLNGGISDRASYSYEPLIIRKASILMALPDKPVIIGR